MSAVTGGERTFDQTSGGRTVTEYRLAEPGRYMSVVVGRLERVATVREGPVTLHAWGVPRFRGEAAALLGQMAGMVRFFAAEFGPCPYTTLNLVVIEGLVPGGHSPPGMVVLSRRPAFVRRSLRDDPAAFHDIPGFFLAHEVAHQWWGHGVAPQNYRERWLSEGFAQYAAARWTELDRGPETFRQVLEHLERWARRENAAGPIHLGFRLGHIQRRPETFRALVYDKGAYVLHMLRSVVGQEPFRRALLDFQASHRYAKAGTDELREALERASGRDLRPYFDDWVFTTTLPTLRFGYRTEPAGSGFRTSIEVRPSNLPGPLPLELRLVQAGGDDARRVELGPGGGTFTFDTPSRPRRVELNADRGLLAITTALKPSGD